MSRSQLRSPTRREFLVLGAASTAALTCVGFATGGFAGAASGGCSALGCTTTTVWMLDPDWGYARGPHEKTHLVSRASRAAAANRVARTEAEALDMNLHLCSWAPATAVSACAASVEAAFADYATNWENPWNGNTVALVDLRRLPPDVDLFTCRASTGDAGPGPSAPGSAEVESGGAARASSPLAFTGVPDRRLLFAGAGAVAAGVLLRGLSGRGPTARAASGSEDPSRDD